MDRRHYLGFLTTALLAGCTESDVSTETPVSTATETPTGTPERHTTAVRTETDSDTATPEETGTEPSTETRTESGTPDPADEALDSIAADIASSVDVYVDAADGDELTDVTAADGVSLADLREPLYDARDTRTSVDTASLTDAQRTRFERLDGCYWFCWWLGATHTDLNAGRGSIETGWDHVLDRNWEEASLAFDTAGTDVATAEQDFEDLESESDPADTNGFDRLSVSGYEAKVEQLTAELAQGEELADILATMVDGFESYLSGGETGYLEATLDFEDAGERLDDTEWRSPFDPTAEDARCVADAMAAGCELLDQASQTAADETERRETLRQQAREEFERCTIVEEDISIPVYSNN